MIRFDSIRFDSICLDLDYNSNKINEMINIMKNMMNWEFQLFENKDDQKRAMSVESAEKDVSETRNDRNCESVLEPMAETTSPYKFEGIASRRMQKTESRK
jgi:hypothetical protein